jgi:hypothetical protein
MRMKVPSCTNLALAATSLAFMVCQMNHAVAQTAIQSVSTGPLKQVNACRAVDGGTGLFTAVTVRHAKTAGATITLQLYDRFKTGGGYDHRTTSKPASPTGVTVFAPDELSSAGLIPPCHQARDPARVSNYFWIATSGNSTKEFLWGQMTMARVK